VIGIVCLIGLGVVKSIIFTASRMV
jgi:hypothetical protein